MENNHVSTEMLKFILQRQLINEQDDCGDDEEDYDDEDDEDYDDEDEDDDDDVEEYAGDDGEYYEGAMANPMVASNFPPAGVFINDSGYKTDMADSNPFINYVHLGSAAAAGALEAGGHFNFGGDPSGYQQGFGNSGGVHQARPGSNAFGQNIGRPIDPTIGIDSGYDEMKAAEEAKKAAEKRSQEGTKPSVLPSSDATLGSADSPLDLAELYRKYPANLVEIAVSITIKKLNKVRFNDQMRLCPRVV